MEPSTLSISPLHVRSNRLDLLAYLADDVAHEIRNPLHAIAINLELARRRAAGVNAADAVSRIDIVEHEVGRVRALVDLLVGLLRQPVAEGARAPFPAALAELRPLIGVMTRLARAELAWTVPGTEDESQIVPGLALRISRHALHQVVLNLVLNSTAELKTRNGGRLEVEARADPGAVTLRVSDDGPGIAPETVAMFGTPGFTTKAGHAGLGVAVARALVEEAGGRLELERAGGVAGTTVRVTIPLAPSA